VHAGRGMVLGFLQAVRAQRSNIAFGFPRHCSVLSFSLFGQCGAVGVYVYVNVGLPFLSLIVPVA
jgi:hypothetical protein